MPEEVVKLYIARKEATRWTRQFGLVLSIVMLMAYYL